MSPLISVACLFAGTFIVLTRALLFLVELVIERSDFDCSDEA